MNFLSRLELLLLIALFSIAHNQILHEHRHQVVGADDDTSDNTTVTESSSNTTEATTNETTEATENATTTTTTEATNATTAANSTTTTSSSTTSSSNVTTFTLQYINDLRYNFFPVVNDSVICNTTDTTQCYGGLACLWQRRSEDNSSLWLHAGNALGTGDNYLALKLDTATAILKLLNFSAMSFDSDMLRFGSRKAAEFVEGVGEDLFVSSNYVSNSSLVQPQSYKLLNVSGQTCRIAVIGMTNVETSESYLAGSDVLDAIEYINSTVSKIRSANEDEDILYIVIGEASVSLAESILESVDNVTLVIHSGYNNITSHTVVTTTVDSKRKVRATLPPADTNSSMLLGQLTLTLDEDCLITATPTYTTTPYGNYTAATCDSGAPANLTSAISAGEEVLNNLTTVIGRSVLTLSGELEPCGIITCSLGQLVADGSRAAVLTALFQEDSDNFTWSSSPRALVLPAWALNSSDPVITEGAKLSRQTLLYALQDDPYLCRATFNGKQLHKLLEAMLSNYSTSTPTSSFPQVSGLTMQVDYTADAGERILGLYAEDSVLFMQAVDSDDESTDTGVDLLFPCVLLERDSYVIEVVEEGVFESLNITTLNITLSDGLGLNLDSEDDLLVPPITHNRVNLLNGWLDTSLICEDWTGPTVFYTILVLAALGMIGYQGYQYWRFRSVLSYVR